MAVNPYIAGNPVGGSNAFIGRIDILNEVHQVLRRPRDSALVLYGQRRIGQTSILKHLEASLRTRGPYRPVYFDLQDKAAWTMDRVLGELARTIAHALRVDAPSLAPAPERAFGANIAGAILGGLAEYTSMLLGFQDLLLVAVAFYSLSAVVLFNPFRAAASGERPLRQAA